MRFLKTIFPRVSLAAAALLLALAAQGCLDFGPFTQQAREQAAARENYLMLAGQYTTSDKTFEFKTLASALTVKALYYSPVLEQAASNRFGPDPAFQKENAIWNYSPKGAPGAPFIILMGLYAPDLTEDDVIKLERFRPILKMPDGRKLYPSLVKRYGRDSRFIGDFFPVFNPWEDVYLVKFDFLPRGDFYNTPLNLLLEWPGGTQSVPLQTNITAPIS